MIKVQTCRTKAFLPSTNQKECIETLRAFGIPLAGRGLWNLRALSVGVIQGDAMVFRGGLQHDEL